VGGTVPHAVLGDAYAPHSVARTLYPSNPRGYFRLADPAESAWTLSTGHAGSRARLTFPPSAPGVVRVEIEQAEVRTGWHIQLSHQGVEVREQERYRVTFRARADSPRRLGYGISQAHSPWAGLGWYDEITVGPEWATIQAEFAAGQSESDARAIFDLGASPLPVEIADFSLQRIPSGKSAVRAAAPQYFVEYRFNDRGCRGPDYAVPRPERLRQRVLALGDSFTLGVGVHEEDTFSRQLEDRLNRRPGAAPGAFEVINCGVSGYSTAQERAFFELLGPVYQPDLVLLAMVFNDELSWREELELGLAGPRYDRTFLLLPLIKRSVISPTFRNSMKELRRLRELTAQMNIPLVVFVFRHTFLDRSWKALRDSVEATLEATGVPWLDVGDELAATHDWRTLLVHDVDGHPNEIAHASTAEQLQTLLEEHHLIP
jgi:lysophospholipase L1-like esterase